MTLAELKKILDKTGLRVAYSHFNSPVDPPFITYVFKYSSNFHADNKTHKGIDNVDIELYTNKKEPTTEKLLEDILTDHDVPFEKFENFIESERMYQIIYEVRLY